MRDTMMIEDFPYSKGQRLHIGGSSVRSCHLLVVFLSVSFLLLGSIGAHAEELHPEAYVGTVVSRSNNEVDLSIEQGVEFGRAEELWIYQKRDAIQIGGVTVKVNWARMGKLRIDSFDGNSAKAIIVDEYPDSPIAVGDEVGRLPNTPPRILSIETDSPEVRPRHEVSICVKAEDDEGDTLSYSAEASDGKLLGLSDRSPVMQWVAPEQPGTCQITVRVSDEKGGVSHQTVSIQAPPVSDTDPYMLVCAIGGGNKARWQFGEVTDIETDERDIMWVLDAQNKLLRANGPTGAEVGAIDLTGLGVTPSRISLGRKDFFYVLDMSHKSLDRMGKRGKPVDRIFDTSNRKVFLLETPSDMEATGDEEVLVTDSAGGHVVVIDKNGKFVLLFAAQGTDRGQLLSPVSITTNKYGDIYVLDSGRGRVLEFDRMFRFRTSYACPMEDDSGKILVDSRNGSVFVLDCEAGSVRKLVDNKLNPHIAPIRGEDSSGPTATSMTIKSNGHIVIGTENASLWQFDASGKLRGIMGEENFGKVPSIAATDDGDLLVLDSVAAQVKRFDRHRWLKGRFGAKGKYKGQFERPARICIDDEGNSYVFDNRRNCIQRFNAIGTFDKLLPVGEDVAGNLKDATDMAITGKGVIYILDAKRKAVFFLSRDGALQKIVPLTASGARSDKQIKRPADLATDGEGTIYVSDPLAYVVHKFDADGKRIQKLGGKGKEPGQFGKIADLAADKRGFLYVLLKDRNAVAKFDKDGRFQMEIPLNVDTETPLKNAEVIAVDSFGALYVYDTAHKAVFKFMQ